MTNRVNVNITARDLTRGELARMRRNFNALGQDVNRAVGNRTRQNFARLSQSVNQSRRDLMAMRGAIPDDEFFRLDRSMRLAQRTMQRGFGNVGDRAFARVVARLREVDEGFRNLNDNAQIRVRVDNSALRRADARLAQWQRQQNARIRASQNAILRADRRLAAGLRTRDGGSTRVRVRVDPDTRGFGRRLRSGILRWTGLRQTGSIIGGILSDGIGQGIISGFRSAGPIGIAVFAGIIAASVSVIGAALAGLLVTALGLAFIGVAAVSAAQSDEVQRNWAAALDKLKGHFKSVGEPLIPVLHEAVHTLEDLADRVAPKFREAMVRAAPAVDEFIDLLFEGLEEFGAAAFDPIMDAFNVFGPVFGEIFKEFMKDLGENFGELAELVSQHSEEIGLAVQIIFKIISGLLEVVEFLTEAWINMVHSANTAFSILINYGLIPLAEAALNSFELILDAMVLTFGKVPGMGEALKGAQKAFGEFKDDALGKLRTVGEAADGANDRLDKLNKVRQLKAEIRSWKADLAEARAAMKKTTSQKAKAKLAVETAQAIRKIAALKARLAAVRGKSVNVNVHTTYTSTSVGGHPTQRRKATGGNIGSAATGGARSNMTLVGEQGPELVDLAPGSRVRSNPDTRRLLGGQGGSGGSGGTFVFKSSGRRVDDLLLEILREAIHQRGGDPIAVLGG